MKKKIEVETGRWTEEDKSIFWCTICGSYHYKTSRIGQRHRAFEKNEEVI